MSLLSPLYARARCRLMGQAWSVALRATLVATVTASLACTPDFQKLPVSRGERGSLGEETYKLLCRHTAGTELPSDLDGRESARICLGDADSVARELSVHGSTYPAALRALAERRGSLVVGVDTLAPAPLPHELDTLMRSLVPFYDAPDPRVPNASRAMAAWLAGFAEDRAAQSALARQLRDGMVPPEATNGIVRALTASPALGLQLHVLLPALLDGALADTFVALRSALALDFSAAEDTPGDDALSRLFSVRDSDSPSQFGTDAALRTAARDLRAMPLPQLHDGQLAYPFVDADGDGRADMVGDRFARDARFSGSVPEPYAVLGEASVARDAEGRACSVSPADGSDCAHTLYAYTDDRAGSLLSALIAEAGRAADEGAPLLRSMLSFLPALLATPAPLQKTFGAYAYDYSAGGGDDDPLLALLHAFSATEESASFDDSMAAMTALVDQARDPLAAALAPWLQMLARTKTDEDAYPEAQLSPDNTFWDAMLWEGERLSRRRLVRGGESALSGLARSVLGYVRAPSDPTAEATRLPLVSLAHAGALLALTTRFKDEWRSNPRALAAREKDEPDVIGAFVTPVDRARPDAPMRCGRDGCGGLLADSAFMRFRLPGQECVVEHDAQRAQGTDCGESGNQSLLQRALGLMAESYGRPQCNRPLAIADLVDQALGDPCQTLDPVTSCQSDADCARVRPTSADYVCDLVRHVCIAPPASARCTELQKKRTDDRKTLIFLAEQALALDYVCPTDDKSAACHAFADTYPGAFIDPDGAGPAPTAIQTCHLIHMTDVGRVFGYALNGDYTFTVPNPWARRFLEDIARAGPVSATDERDALPDCGLAYRITDPRVTPPCVPLAARATRQLFGDIPADVDLLGELIEHLLGNRGLFASDADARDLRPDVKVLTRVLFAAGPAEGVQLFEPFLIRGAPPLCASAPGLPACALSGAIAPPGSCCIASDLAPPLQYRLDTYFGATTFALEHPVTMSDGSALSFLDVARPIAAVFNRSDVDPTLPAPRADVEDTDYGLLRLGKLVAEHYDSARNPVAQSHAVDGVWYRHGTGLVNYELLLADLLDDGTVDASQPGPGATPLVSPSQFADRPKLAAYRGVVALVDALLQLDHTSSESMLDALVHGAALLLNPHVYCAGDGGDDRVLSGTGACDATPPVRTPIARRDGRSAPCWNDGRCFDGSAPDRPRRYVSSLALARDAIGDIGRRADVDARTRAARDDVLVRASHFVFDSAQGVFTQPRAIALVRAFLRHGRDEWARDRSAGVLPGKAERDERELADDLRSPVVAAALQLVRALGRDDALSAALIGLVDAALRPEGQRALMASISELLELAHGSSVIGAGTRAFAPIFVRNVDDLVRGDASQPDLDQSSLATELRVLETLSAADDSAVLGRLAHNLSALGEAEPFSPLDRFSDALVAVHRVEAGSTEPYDAADLAQIAAHLSDFLRDDRRGVERLIDVVRCVTSSPKPANCGD